MNPNEFNHLNMSFRIVPTVRKNPYAQKSAYKFKQYIEEGRVELPEPELDVTQARDLLAQFTLKR